MGKGTKVVAHEGTGIFYKHGYGDGYYSTLPIGYPLPSLKENNSYVLQAVCCLAWYSSWEVTWVMSCHDLLLMSLRYFKKIDLFFNGSNHSLKPIYLSKSIHEIFLKMVKQHLFLDPHDLFFLNKKFNLVLLRALLMSLLTVQDRSWEHSLWNNSYKNH